MERDVLLRQICEMEKIRFIYVYDAFCGWCYGFTPVVAALYDKYNSQFDFEVISGGMITGNRVGPIGVIAPYIKNAYKTVEETTGIKFGEGYLRNVEEGKMILDSEKPAIALAVFRSYVPDKAVLFAHDMQNAINFDGADPNHNDMYRYIAVNHGIDPDEVQHKLLEDTFKEKAYYDFAMAKQLGVTGYPAAFLQVSEQNLYMIARGYTDLDTMETRINNVLHEVN
jgi:putative protein-disulfide isomerase